MALSGSYTVPEFSLTVPGAYLRVEGIGLERLSGPATLPPPTGPGTPPPAPTGGPAWRLVVTVAVYSSQEAAASGARPLTVRYIDLSPPSAAVLGGFLTTVYGLIKARPDFSGLQDAQG